MAGVRSTVFVSLAAVAGFVPSVASAGMTFVTDARGIVASAEATPVNGASLTPVGPNDFLAFDDSTSATLTEPGTGTQMSSATASQVSTTSANEIVLSGRAQANGFTAYAGARSLFDMTFDVTGPATYDLGISLAFLQGTFDDPTGSFGADAVVSLRQLGEGGETEIAGGTFPTAGNPSPIGGDVADTGSLGAGRYRLIVDVSASANAGAPSGNPEVSFNGTFRVTDGPVPIPLPPAAWAGISGLLLAAGAAARTRRVVLA